MTIASSGFLQRSLVAICLGTCACQTDSGGTAVERDVTQTVSALQPDSASNGSSKPATNATKAANRALAAKLDFADKQDFDDARQGLIEAPPTLTIKNAKGDVVWDLEQYKQYIGADKPAPDTVNPSLWRNAQLNMNYGLFKVTDRIYQVRGYDLSNISFIQGDKGWIVCDPLISAETAKAAFELVTKNLGKRPVVAVIYSHSHVDHFGGVRGIVDSAQVRAGKVQIIAPENFTEEAVSENVIAGNAMGRRAVYMYGAVLPRSPQGGVNGGLGQTTSTGEVTLIEPTKFISKTGTELNIDGVKMVFQMTPGTEAPAEMNVYFPQFKSIWMAENATHTLHNVLTLRGAKVRDPQIWAHYLDETLQLWGTKIESEFASHHWPMWGNDRIQSFLERQRSLYKYINDQSLHLINQGCTAVEVSNMVKLPPELDRPWFNRGYYGSVKHDARAVYQRYMGFYDSNPSTLDELEPVEAAKKYLEYMGGSAAVLKKAQADFDDGQYRWVAMAIRHVVFAEPDNRAAKFLLADAYEQMGYQAESGPWRSEYLQGAFELRNGVPKGGGTVTASPDVVRAMSPELLFDYLGVRLNGERAAGKRLVMNLRFTDLRKDYALTVADGVLDYSTHPDANADASLTLTKATLDRI